VLDLDRFIAFMVMEVMVGHRDGYCLARNNYRLYHDPGADKFVFLPHGMDQLMGKADAPLEPHMSGLVARAVLETPEGHRRYREQFALLYKKVFDVAALSQQIDQWAAVIRPVLSGQAARSFATEVADLKDRLKARHRSLDEQLRLPELKLLAFENKMARVTNWVPVDLPAGGAMNRAPAPDGRIALHIKAGPVTLAGWRCKVLLPPGRYRWEGSVCTVGVEPLPYGRNQGAGLRVQGLTQPPPYNLTGDNPWRKAQAEFAVPAPQQEMELICELRASRGDAWFDLDSLRLVQVP
jgi:hypothetical protein